MKRVMQAALVIVAAVIPAACGTEPCATGVTYGIEAQVRTFAGAPAAEGATAEAFRGELSELLERHSDLTFLGVHEPGTYRLVVAKAGYHTHVTEGIEVEGDDCGVETRLVLVNLLPE